MKRKLIAMFLVICMVMTFMPTMAFADDVGQQGESKYYDDYFEEYAKNEFLAEAGESVVLGYLYENEECGIIKDDLKNLRISIKGDGIDAPSVAGVDEGNGSYYFKIPIDRPAEWEERLDICFTIGDYTYTTDIVAQKYIYAEDLDVSYEKSVPYDEDGAWPEINSVKYKGTELDDYYYWYNNHENVGRGHIVIHSLADGPYYYIKQVDFDITPRAITKAKISLNSGNFTYNGKTKKPSVKVKYKTNTLKKDKDYTVKYSSGLKNVGLYKVTVKGKGNYSGTKTLTFKINPRGTSVKSVKSLKKGLTVKWNKQSARMSKSRITGYQIQLATDKKFKKNVKNVTVKGYKAVSKKVTGLKAKTNYYVRIRTYMKVGSKTYYSTWSGAKVKKTR